MVNKNEKQFMEKAKLKLVKSWRNLQTELQVITMIMSQTTTWKR